MPCRDDGYDRPRGKKAKGTTARLDKLTRMLCGLATRVELVNADLINGDGELADWWAGHKKADARRRAEEKEKKRKEKVKREALEKLTDEEKILLGIEKAKKRKPIYDDEDEDDDEY